MMKIRNILATLCVATAFGVQAQSAYPNKPVRVIVPYPAGGITDISARVVLERVGQILGQPMVVDNRPGAGSKIGTDAAIKAPKDGYTLYMNNASYAILPAIDPATSYNAEKDLAPVGQVCTYGLAIVINPQLPARTLKEFIDYARQNPGKVNYGSSGPGSGTHFAGEWLKHLTQTSMVHVPYRSTSLAVQDVAGGLLDMAMDGAVKSYVDSGKVRLLAVTDARRDPRFLNTPTAAEAGFPDFEQISWLALFAPVGTPAAIVAVLNKALNEAVADPAVSQKLADLGMTPKTGTPADLLKVVANENRQFRKIAAATKIKVE